MTTTNIVQAQSAWNGDGLTIATAYTPKIAADYPTIQNVQQIGDAVPPDPCTVQFQCDNDTLQALKNDSNYNTTLQVISSY